MFFLIPLALTALSSGAAIWNQIDQNSQLQAQATDALKNADATNTATRQEQDVKYVAAVDAARQQAETARQQALKTAESARNVVTTVFIVLAIASLALTLRMLYQKK